MKESRYNTHYRRKDVEGDKDVDEVGYEEGDKDVDEIGDE